MPIAHNYACCTTCGRLLHKPSFQAMADSAYCAYCQAPSRHVPAGLAIATTTAHGREFDVCQTGVTPSRKVATPKGLLVEIDGRWYRACSETVGLNTAWRFARQGRVFMRAGKHWREVIMSRQVPPPAGVERTLETAAT